MHRAFFDKRRARYTDLPAGNVQQVDQVEIAERDIDRLVQFMVERADLTDGELERLIRLLNKLRASKHIANQSIADLEFSEVLASMRRIPEDDRLILSLGGVLVSGEVMNECR